MINLELDFRVRSCENLREVFGIENSIVMYVGNLEPYQGIDLLLEGFSIAINEKKHRASLVMIGGDRKNICKYSNMASRLGIANSVYLIGPRPLDSLASYLSQANILVSPRLKGVNTPMKLFSYLQSGKPTLVTNLVTHTQVVDQKTAFLVDPNPSALSEGLVALLSNRDLCKRLGNAGKQLVEAHYSHDAFIEKFNCVMSWIEHELQSSRGH